MKLTAPPPPPPEPPEQPVSGQPTPNEPIAANPTLPTPVTVAPPAPKTLTWPAWFSGADYLLVTLVLGLTFFLGSFVARNSDLWRHLAAGKRLLAGEYHPGSDPFSYSAVDRPWVNHSLLFDVGAYLFYGGDGALLVVLKALAVVLTFGILIAIRRPGHAFWPWAGITGIAVLVAAPQMTFSPLVGSMLFLAITLFLLFRLKHRPGSWRFPAAIGITFWLWAQVDSWFFLGPMALGLVLVGELIQAQFHKKDKTAGSSVNSEPLGYLPDVRTLAMALGIGVLACMLNPHHVRIWELPLELTGTKDQVVADALRKMFLSPLDKDYRDDFQLGRNWNGLAYALLFVGGGVVLGLGVGKIRFSHLALWLGFALLSLASIYAIPFFAVVAVPLVAWQLNAFSSQLTLKTWADPKTKLLLLGSACGRVGCLILLAIACVVSWPGWLHPEPPNPAFNRRVAWGIETDPGLVQTAQQLQSWREHGTIPSDARGMIVSMQLADYCAWFAPLEKVFVNGNYKHHSRELPELISLRKSLGFTQNEPMDSVKAGNNLDSIGASYLVMASTQGDGPRSRSFPAAKMLELSQDNENWLPWYMNGRASVTGWKSARDVKQSQSFDLHFDPIALAFGRSTKPLGPTSVKPIPPKEGWEGEFLHGTGASPPELDQAYNWMLYWQFLQKRNAYAEIADMISDQFRLSIPSTTGFTHHRLAQVALGSVRRPRSDQLDAASFLSLRAARQAIAADRDNPDGYFALSLALSSPELPMSESERAIGQVTALRQCLMRMPQPSEYRKNVYRAAPSEVARLLAMFYFGERFYSMQRRERASPNASLGLPLDIEALQMLQLTDGAIAVDPVQHQLVPMPLAIRERRQVIKPSLRAVDLAREMMLLSLQYAEKEDSKDLEALKSMSKTIEESFVKMNEAYELEGIRGRHKQTIDRFSSALRNNLVGKALEILTDKDTSFEKEFGKNTRGLVLILIGLEMATGRLEEVAGNLGSDYAESLRTAETTEDERAIQSQILAMDYQKMVFEGNYEGAREAFEKLMTRGVARRVFESDPPLSKAESSFESSPAFQNPVFQKLGLDPLEQIALLMPTSPVLSLPLGALRTTVTIPYRQRQQELTRVRRYNSDFYHKLGVLSLLDGDIPKAQKHFEQTRQKGAPEWGVEPVRNNQAERYLHLIEEAEKSPGK